MKHLVYVDTDMRSSRDLGEERFLLLVTSCNEPDFFLGGDRFKSFEEIAVV
jgi:hypothetical protein